jgi:hypothetical protein
MRVREIDYGAAPPRASAAMAGQSPASRRSAGAIQDPPTQTTLGKRR